MELKTAMYLDVKQFAERSGLPFHTVEGLIKDKRLPHVIVGRKRMVLASQLDNLEALLGGKVMVVEKGVGDASSA